MAISIAQVESLLVTQTAFVGTDSRLKMNALASVNLRHFSGGVAAVLTQTCEGKRAMGEAGYG